MEQATTNMKILVIGDPHFREGNSTEMEFLVDFTLQFLESHPEIDWVVVLGDILDRHGVLHQQPFHQSCRFLHRLGAMKKTYVLIGNHDFDNPSRFLPDNHPFLMWKLTECPGVVIVDKPLFQDGYVFVPYVPPGMFQRALEYIDPSLDFLSGTDIIFAHQEFKGCRMGPVISEAGDVWPLPNMDHSPFIISGHIHDKQLLDNGILYVGTPIQNGYADSYTDKGLCVFDTVTREGEWHHVPVPRKMTVRVSHGEELDGWILLQYERLYGKFAKDVPRKSSTAKPTAKPITISALFRTHDTGRPIIGVLDRIKLIIYTQDTQEVKKSLLKGIQETLPSVVKISVEIKPVSSASTPSSPEEGAPILSLSEIVLNKFNPTGDPVKQQMFAELIRA